MNAIVQVLDLLAGLLLHDRISNENGAMMRIPRGFASGMQRWPCDEVIYLWFYQDLSQIAQLKEVVPFFDAVAVGWGARAPIDSIFVKPGAKGLIGAVKFIARPDVLYIDFMSVRKGWRRRGINSLMIRTLVTEFPGRQLAFSEPTAMGSKFIQGKWPVIEDLPGRYDC
jgi:hypothetical protein